MEKELFRCNDKILVLQICAILEDNNIPYIKKDEGSLSYLNTVAGSNSGLKRVWVSEEDYEKAKELIKMFEDSLK